MAVGKTFGQDDLYAQATDAYGTALERLARAYEAAPDTRRDLLQDIHLAVWQSLSDFEGRCSLRTWVYRVAHNVAISHVVRRRRMSVETLVDLEELAAMPDLSDHERASEDRLAVERLLALIHRLKPIDRQIMLLYLEDTDATSIGEVTGLSPGHVRVQIHRIKAILAKRFHAGGRNDS